MTTDEGTFTVGDPGPVTTADILINEVMYAPTTAWGGQYNEWIELYNNDTAEVNITDWVIDGKAIASGMTMQPGDCLIIAKNDTKFTEYYPNATCALIKVAISLKNDGELLCLNNSLGYVADSLNFTEYVSMADKNNKTLEMNATGGWEASLVDGGTPCDENSVMNVVSVLTVTADPASVTENITTDVTFTVTCDGSAVGGALVTLLGCGVDANSSTNENGTATISVTATEAGTINVTATMGDYGDAATTITVTADSQPSGSAITISNGSADAGATSTVTITADGVTDLANFDITVTYDPAVAIVTDAANDAAFVTAVNNLETAANGTVRLASFNFGDGQTGDGVLLSTLTLEAVGTAGQTSALTLTINGLLDSTEAVIDVTPVDGVFTVNGSGTASLAVTVDPTSVTENITTDVTFTVTCDGSAVDGALVTLLGCGVDVNGTTGADGAVILSVTATDIGTIDVTATKDACDDATTGLDVVSDESTPLTILPATLSPNVVLSDGSESTTLTVQASSSIAIASVTVNLSAIGGSDEQALDGTQMEGTGTWNTTFNTTSEGTFDLTVTVTDRDGNSATSDVTLTAGPYKYTLSLKTGWNMVSLPYDIAAVGIDTTQKLGDMITDAGVSCYYVAWFNPTSQMMESDLISPPEGMLQDTTYPIVGGQAYFVFVKADTEVAVVGTLW